MYSDNTSLPWYVCDDQSVNLSQNRSSTIFRKNLVSFSLFFWSCSPDRPADIFVTDRDWNVCYRPADIFVTDFIFLLPTDEDLCYRPTKMFLLNDRRRFFATDRRFFFCYRPEVFVTDRRTFFVTDRRRFLSPTEIFATDQRRFFVLLKYGKTCFATY